MSFYINLDVLFRSGRKFGKKFAAKDENEDDTSAGSAGGRPVNGRHGAGQVVNSRQGAGRSLDFDQEDEISNSIHDNPVQVGCFLHTLLQIIFYYCITQKYPPFGSSANPAWS